MYLFFLDILIAWILFPEQLMTLNKCKKLYTTQGMSAFIIYDSLGFKNVALYSPLAIKHITEMEVVNDSFI